MNNFSKSIHLVLQILAVLLITSNAPVNAMQPEEQEQNIFSRELEALNRSDKRFGVTEQNMPRFHAMVQDLSGRLGIDVPKVYIVDDETANAKARDKSPLDFGRESNYIQLNTGLLEGQSDAEIEFVTAHELSHMKLKHGPRFDYCFLKSFIMLIFLEGLNYHVGGSNSSLLPMAICFFYMLYESRCYEKEADLLAVQITRNPTAAISSFNKALEAEPWIEKICPDFFSTHPDIEKRIKYIKTAFKK